MYHICDPLNRLFSDSTPVATQSPMERFHTTSRRPYNEMAAMLVFQTNPVGVELFSYLNTFFFPSLLLELPNINERSAVKESNHPMVHFTPDAAIVSRNRSHAFWHFMGEQLFQVTTICRLSTLNFFPPLQLYNTYNP